MAVNLVTIDENVNKLPNGCWEWPKQRKCRYIRIQVEMNGKKKLEGLHRVAYELYYGPFDKSLFVCHCCDNTKCCNPEHLFLGTQQDNIKDKLIKGRQPHGEKHHRWKGGISLDSKEYHRKYSKEYYKTHKEEAKLYAKEHYYGKKDLI